MMILHLRTKLKSLINSRCGQQMLLLLITILFQNFKIIYRRPCLIISSFLLVCNFRHIRSSQSVCFFNVTFLSFVDFSDESTPYPSIIFWILITNSFLMLTHRHFCIFCLCRLSTLSFCLLFLYIHRDWPAPRPVVCGFNYLIFGEWNILWTFQWPFNTCVRYSFCCWFNRTCEVSLTSSKLWIS